MPPIALELNDAALVALGPDGIVATEPGLAGDAGTGVVFGSHAASLARRNPLAVSSRHWREPTRTPLRRPLPGLSTGFDVAVAQLRHLWARVAGAGSADPALVVLPSAVATGAMDAISDVCRAAGVPVRMYADPAIAATRAPHPGRELVHLDAGLHGLTVTRLAQSQRVSIVERQELVTLGVESFRRVVAEVFARRFVECSRFDPLHDGDSEQALHDALPGWMTRLGLESDLEISLTRNGGTFAASVPASLVRARVAAFAAPLTQKLRAEIAGRGPVALLLHEQLAGLPGFLDALLQAGDVTVTALEPGAAARGLLARAALVTDAQSAVVELPFDLPAVESATASVPAASRSRRPTHIVRAGRAWRLDGRPFEIGIEVAAGEYGIAVDPGVRGVSRRHCTLRAEGGVLMVFDHSRYGTLLNGHKIEGAAVLEGGDVIAMGLPPTEFRLVTEVTGGSGDGT